ncbi:hypothetical protein PanWU01x14_235960 [Parasponia andersonii]|uniref:Uncharacterized protein n=1 Tax=Parasponia andersonii TaxID=3476 RepID=A0A2P5BIK0_PARAD|nr:hypothetical protein PanWU01x14_235960 [Parasponia andersonii]
MAACRVIHSSATTICLLERFLKGSPETFLFFPPGGNIIILPPPARAGSS